MSHIPKIVPDLKTQIKDELALNARIPSALLLRTLKKFLLLPLNGGFDHDNKVIEKCGDPYVKELYLMKLKEFYILPQTFMDFNFMIKEKFKQYSGDENESSKRLWDKWMLERKAARENGRNDKSN